MLDQPIMGCLPAGLPGGLQGGRLHENRRLASYPPKKIIKKHIDSGEKIGKIHRIDKIKPLDSFVDMYDLELRYGCCIGRS